MNFLAHLFFSPDDPDWRLGGLLGDFVKGPINNDVTGQYPERVVSGIRLHRCLDVFTNSNSHFKISVSRISKEDRRYAPILVDMYYDHLLATHWSTYCEENLDTYVTRVYQELSNQLAPVPPNFSLVTNRMIRENWLKSYETIEGIGLAIDRVGRRLKRGNALLGTVHHLRENLDAFEQDFHHFMSDALPFVSETIRRL